MSYMTITNAMTRNPIKVSTILRHRSLPKIVFMLYSVLDFKENLHVAKRSLKSSKPKTFKFSANFSWQNVSFPKIFCLKKGLFFFQLDMQRKIFDQRISKPHVIAHCTKNIKNFVLKNNLRQFERGMLIRKPTVPITLFVLQLAHFKYFTFAIDYYRYEPHNVVLLSDETISSKRRKRQSSDELHDDDTIPMNATFPPDAEIEDDNETTEHTYYNRTVYTKPEYMKKYYVDMEKWINQKDVNGTTKHDHLISSYRKAAGVKLKFEFPFYGHKLTNLTIATGGFCYVGDQTHSWLAATQYIAPLMANFDTMADNSTIMYGDNGERMIVEWSKVKLKDNRAAGQFTFQLSLMKNGDIYFVYKDIPISPKNISDIQHPCKLGISDAYLFNHKLPIGASSQSATQSKRIIHEYHRITVDPETITSNTVVVLTALPTCLGFDNCADCSHANLKSFQCSWCSPSNSPEKAFCSDQTGLNRRRQEWVEGNCIDEKKQLFCDSLQNLTTKASTSTQITPANTKFPASVFTTATPEQHPESVVPLSNNDDKKNSKGVRTSDNAERRSENSGLAFLTLLIVVVVAFCIWLLYAFYNPHTTSGQLLIKYRPSKWQIPSSHVRYSASVHM